MGTAAVALSAPVLVSSDQPWLHPVVQMRHGEATPVLDLEYTCNPV